MRNALTVAFVCLTSMACQPVLAPIDANQVDEGTARLADGSPEALGLIAFLNDVGTTYELLDHDVGLDRRAAESLIAHRNGPDGELGWLSDNLFETVQDIDDCYYVGSTAFGLLEAWAIDNGWVALNDDDVLGTFDGVEFTVAQANAAVELANTAGPNYLDIELAMNARTVDHIVDARPVGSIQELAAVKYVGGAALRILKDAAQGEPACEIEGWDTEYITNDDGAWRHQLPAEYVAIVDETLEKTTWCEASTSQPWFVKATVDRFNCEAKGYTIELGQGMVEYPEVSWYIEFEVNQEFSWFLSTCEV